MIPGRKNKYFIAKSGTVSSYRTHISNRHHIECIVFVDAVKVVVQDAMILRIEPCGNGGPTWIGHGREDGLHILRPHPALPKLFDVWYGTPLHSFGIVMSVSQRGTLTLSKSSKAKPHLSPSIMRMTNFSCFARATGGKKER